MTAPSRSRVLLAFAAVYVIWGSTYLAIRFAIETLPPFLMAGVRFLIAGAILYAVARRSSPAPTKAQWKAAAIVGTLLLLGGNGGVVWAELRVPSGIAALMVAMVPCWMVLLDWAWPGGRRPAPQVFLGVLLGLGGLFWLVGPDAVLGGNRVDPVGAGVLALASLAWAAGSIYSRHSPSTDSPLLGVGMQMLTGGTALMVFGLVVGDFGRFDPAAVSVRSGLALLYLITFGAIVGYSAYMWLLRVSTPAKVSTYAYVNPIVAVVLGWAFADEVLNARIGVAAAVIIAGVALITIARRRPERTGPAPAVSGGPKPPCDDVDPPARERAAGGSARDIGVLRRT
jgi:drug/metabolite transporter (DMT)-like permease